MSFRSTGPRAAASAAASIEQYGGRYLVRGGAIEPLEGTWMPQAIVIVEFPTMDQARAYSNFPVGVEGPTKAFVAFHSGKATPSDAPHITASGKLL